jgi:HSP20 family protein
VEGTRKRPDQDKPENRYYSERAYGGFHRIVHLPTSVDAENVQANLRNGVLSVSLPKRVRGGGKKVEIGVS